MEYLMPIGFVLGIGLGVLFRGWNEEAFDKYGGWISGGGILVCGLIIVVHRLLTGGWQ
jgi:hypothetical protein